MTAPLRIGLWGVGSHARKNLIPALAECTETELVAALSRSEQDLPNIEGVDDVDRFLSTDLDVVLIAGPPGLHAEQAMQALETGHHVWVEKPATTSLTDAQTLVDRAQELGLVVLETDMFLHHPQWTLLRSLTERVGGTDSVTARFGFPHLPPDNIRYRADLGGGALNDAGFYPVAAAIDLLGEDVRVAAASLIHGNRDVDTAGGALLVDQEGRRAHLEWGFGRGYRSEVEVWGPDGWLRAERVFAKPADLPTEVAVRTSDGSMVEAAEPSNHFVRMYATFAEATRSGSRLGSELLLRRARATEGIRRA